MKNTMYYVYVYLNVLKPGNFIYDDVSFKYEPFYIGKGKNNRIMRSIKLEYDPRPQQIEILDFVKDTIQNKKKKFMIIDAPTGCLTKNEKIRIYKLKK